MAIQSNFPTIRPSLLLDFANSKRLDPRVTFTRASTARYYDGVTVAKAEENLLLNSATPLNASWSIVNGYAGTLGGTEFITNGAFTTNVNNWTAQSGDTVSWDAGGGGRLKIEDTNSAGAGVAYQIPTLTIGKIYRLEYSSELGTATQSRVYVGTAINNSSMGFKVDSGAVTNSSIVFTATTTVPLVQLVAQTTGSYSYFKNISVKELTADNKTAPDGTATAVTLTAGIADATFTQSVTAVAADYTFSVWLRRVTGTGNVDISAHSGGTWVTQTISGTWARYTVTQTLTAGTRTPGIRITTAGDQVEVWGAQLEQRSAVTAYTATTTAPITNYIPALQTAQAGVPRFDHNPTTGESLGLLIEEARTNTILRSEEFGTTWSATRATVSANQVIAPDGALTADRIIDTTDNDTHFVSQTFTGTAASWTLSVYAKASGLNHVALRLFNGTSQVGLAYYNLSTGATGTVTAGTATITSAGNGWYRCALTATLAASASCTADIQLASADNTNSFAGNAWNGVALWGAQVEAGAFPTSYIPTTAASATRQTEDASMTGTNFSSWYDAAEGTLYAETTKNSRVNDFYAAQIGTSQNAMFFSPTSATVSRWRVRVGAVDQALISVTAGSGAQIKQAAVYKANDFAFAVDASAVGTDTAGSLPVVNQMLIGLENQNNVYCNTTIRKIAYYPARLTNAQLQALTG